MVHGQEPVPADQLAPNSPLLEAQNDTIDSLAVETTPQTKKEAIDAKIEYSSSDSVVITGKGIATLFGSGELNYKSMNLTAEYIRMHMDSSTLYAKGVLDTIVDEWVGKPVFTEGEESYETSEISFNFKTQKAYIRNVITEQGEGFLIAYKTKKL